MICFSSLGPASAGHFFRFLASEALSRPSGRAFLPPADLSPAFRFLGNHPLLFRPCLRASLFSLCRRARVGAGFFPIFPGRRAFSPWPGYPWGGVAVAGRVHSPPWPVRFRHLLSRSAR
jgi:hypothetical protein